MGGGSMGGGSMGGGSMGGGSMGVGHGGWGWDGRFGVGAEVGAWLVGGIGWLLSVRGLHNGLW